MSYRNEVDLHERRDTDTPLVSSGAPPSMSAIKGAVMLRLDSCLSRPSSRSTVGIETAYSGKARESAKSRIVHAEGFIMIGMG